jgi:hypothetical protein
VDKIVGKTVDKLGIILNDAALVDKLVNNFVGRLGIITKVSINYG